MFDDDRCETVSNAHLLETGNQACHCPLMEADRRLIQDISDTREVGTDLLLLNALVFHLTAIPADRNVCTEPHIVCYYQAILISLDRSLHQLHCLVKTSWSTVFAVRTIDPTLPRYASLFLRHELRAWVIETVARQVAQGRNLISYKSAFGCGVKSLLVSRKRRLARLRPFKGISISRNPTKLIFIVEVELPFGTIEDQVLSSLEKDRNG